MTTKLVAIVNVTPDSFSGDGTLAGDKTLQKIAAAIDEGADVIDIGAESTRPEASGVTAANEIRRLETVLYSAREKFPRAILSIDTRHAPTAEWAIRSGASWINDVCGFQDPAMIEAVAGSTVKLVVMHSLTVPPTSAVTLPEGCDPVAAVIDFWQLRSATLLEHGIARERLIFDPGIGFGKTAAQSLILIENAGLLQDTLGVPLLIGHSRKSFLSRLNAETLVERDAATVTLSKRMMAQGIAYLRVHAVPAHQQARKTL